MLRVRSTDLPVTRLIRVDDAPVLADLLSANRDFLAPWEPRRADDYFTVAGQDAVVRELLDAHAQGRTLPHVIVDDHDRPVGRITLSGIVHGAFRSCSVGYWVDAEHNGRGLATRAVSEVARLAFTDLRLHRVQAETLEHNVASQRILQRRGFVRIGMAPAYLHIAGRWQDHVLWQLLADR